MVAYAEPVQNYYLRNFPSRVPIRAYQGFAATVCLSTLHGTGLQLAALKGGVAIITTIAEAIFRPFLFAIFDRNSLAVMLFQVIVPGAMIKECAIAIDPWMYTVFKSQESWSGVLFWFMLNSRCITSNEGMATVLA